MNGRYFSIQFLEMHNAGLLFQSIALLKQSPALEFNFPCTCELLLLDPAFILLTFLDTLPQTDLDAIRCYIDQVRSKVARSTMQANFNVHLLPLVYVISISITNKGTFTLQRLREPDRSRQCGVTDNSCATLELLGRTCLKFPRVACGAP